MAFRGPHAYDQKEFLSEYMKRRGRKDSPNNAIETPVIYELIGSFEHQNILDLGCGDASFGMELLEQGAKSYIGVEGSKQMAEAAAVNLEGKGGEIYFGSMESYHYPANEFDLVTSRFAIHYVSELDSLFNNIYKSLASKGRFVFSVQHPLTTASFLSKQSGERRGNWIVDDYFISGERNEPWIDQVVVKYHRTIEHYFRALTRAGFSVVDLREGNPERKHFSNDEEFKRRQRIPVVLAFSCVK